MQIPRFNFEMALLETKTLISKRKYIDSFLKRSFRYPNTLFSF
jgi:hypothetical protein